MYDLRSDTVTRPSEGMRKAMADAEVGDDVYREDPTVRQLEERTAAIVGKDASLFVPSGTMANLIAILSHTRPGDEVICGTGSHCVYYESGGAAAWAGVQFEQVGHRGLFTGAHVKDAIKPRDYYCPNTRAVVVENTHNRAGGRVFPQSDIDSIAKVARREKLALHLDGARIWNAAAAQSRPVAELCAPFDTVSVCFSKGLGAPVGSALCGDVETVQHAIRFRKMLGGGMRQAGVLAAGALYALENNRDRVSEDHEAARELASALRELSGTQIDDVETNIVNVTVPVNANRVTARALEHGVLFSAVDSDTLRLVTHCDVTGPHFDGCIGAVIQAFREALRGN